MKPQLAAITISVKDLPLLRQYYTEVFGWGVLMENPEIVILKLGETLLSLCTEKLFTTYTGITPANGNKNFYFTIDAKLAANVDALFAELQAKGAHITKMPEKTFWGGYSGFLADPEGNLWEISCNLN